MFNTDFTFICKRTTFPNLHETWDCTQTEIKYVEVLSSFFGTIGVKPEVLRHFENGTKIEIVVDDWVLPNSMIVFVWRLNGEGVENNERSKLH